MLLPQPVADEVHTWVGVLRGQVIVFKPRLALGGSQ
jgi:hypothetical protein